MAYVPRPFPGRVLAFWPTEDSGRQAGDPTLGWGPLVEHVEVIHVPGNHQTIVTRQTGLIAHAIQARRCAEPDTPLREIRNGSASGPSGR